MNYAECRCGGRIFERSLSVDGGSTQWAHVDAFDNYRTELCPDGLTAIPMMNTQTNPARAR